MICDTSGSLYGTSGFMFTPLSTAAASTRAAHTATAYFGSDGQAASIDRTDAGISRVVVFMW